jgi:pSer/pThr/pTyr-binding forkhead associated (FHA) protein
MGKYDRTIVISKDRDEKTNVVIPSARLVVITGAQSGIEFAIKKSKLVLGRSDEADLIFDAPGISRMHAEIAYDKQFTIRDLNSTNGVSVNGTKVDNYPLKNGDKIKLGELVFQFILLD